MYLQEVLPVTIYVLVEPLDSATAPLLGAEESPAPGATVAALAAEVVLKVILYPRGKVAANGRTAETVLAEVSRKLTSNEALTVGAKVERVVKEHNLVLSMRYLHDVVEYLIILITSTVLRSTLAKPIIVSEPAAAIVTILEEVSILLKVKILPFIPVAEADGRVKVILPLVASTR
jgi:hypothetical protein